MSIFTKSQRRQVPKPDLVGPHQSFNPLFESPSDWSAFRLKVYSYTGLGLALTIVAWLIYGPWFAVRQVTVTGTRLLDPRSVKASAERYISHRRWLILPNRTIWILSSTGLEKTLEQQIRQRISIDQITVVKTLPHSLSINVAERTPVATWTNGTIFGSIDKQGKIIELRAGLDTNLPTVRDENGNIFSVDSSVVKQEVIAGLVAIAGQMKLANIQVQEYLIPVPVCPMPVLPVPNINTNSGGGNTNSSSEENFANRNSNTAILNVNTGVPVTPVCDHEALRYGSQEIHAKLVDGPRVFFDRHHDPQQAVQALQRVLSEHTDKTYTTIDVRFGDRVYVQ